MSQIGQYADTLQAMELDRRMENVGGAKGDNWFDEAANEEIAQQYAATRDRHLAGRPARIRAAMLQMEIVCPPTSSTTKAPSMEREDSAVSAQTELAAVPPKETALTVFSTVKGLEPWLLQVRLKVDEFQKVLPDLKTKKGRDAYASMAHQIAKSKTALEAVGKEISAQQKEIPKKIDAERKRVWDLLESWQKEVRKPLDEWEAAETARKDRHVDAIQAMRDAVEEAGPLDAAQIQAAIEEMEARVIDESWEEFVTEAAQVKDQCLLALRNHLKARQVYEAEQAELARLRAEAEARAKADHEAAIAREAAERAQREADERAAAERAAAAKREQDLLDQAAAQQREAENQRLQLQLQAEQAERQAAQAEADRLAAIQAAEIARIEAEKNAERAAEQARLDEQRRQQAAADELVRQQQARERDEAHRRNINRAALDAFVAGGMPEACAKQAVTLIAQRKIPAIAITY
ncbi:hypothetical protein PMM47T1_14055 [Pseudomonas sp. M47T1]|nr:hypothetical protein PMM47T1_14055 [Pseudomonas sp. M47T1]